MIERTHYHGQIRIELAWVDSMLALLATRVEESESPRRDVGRELLLQLRQRRDEFERQLEDLVRADQPAWGELRSDLETSRIKLLQNLDRAFGRFQSTARSWRNAVAGGPAAFAATAS